MVKKERDIVDEQIEKEKKIIDEMTANWNWKIRQLSQAKTILAGEKGRRGFTDEKMGKSFKIREYGSQP